MSIFGLDDTAPEREGDERPSLEPYIDSPKGTLSTVDGSSVKQALSHAPMSAERSSTSVGTSTGTRAADAFIRPTPFKVAGRITSYGFNLGTSVFDLSVTGVQHAETEPTEIFVPLYHFPRDKLNVEISDGRWTYENETQTLLWWHGEGEQTLKITGVKRFTESHEDDTYFDMVKNVGCTIA